MIPSLFIPQSMINVLPQVLPQTQTLNQWVSLKMRPTSLGSNKNKPGKKYAK